MRIFLIALALLGTTASVSAMDVASFLAQSAKIESKGALAVFYAGDISMLIDEIKAASQRLKAERLAAAAEGRQPAYCPAGKAGLNQDELMSAMRAVPEEQRPHVILEDAMRPALARKYPCTAPASAGTAS